MCDSYNDCGDNSDQFGCSKPGFLIFHGIEAAQMKYVFYYINFFSNVEGESETGIIHIAADCLKSQHEYNTSVVYVCIFTHGV